jgi:hypothetical protein
MSSEVEKILNMLLEGKITKDEAMKLIDAIYGEQEKSEVSKSRGIKIEVTENDEKVASINLPLNMLKFLIKTARITNKSHIEVEGKEIPIDINELEQILNDPTFKGKLLDVDANDEGKNIKVLIEVV